jgi:hypothetical protein
MWRRLLIASVAIAGMSFAVTVVHAQGVSDVHSQGMGVGAQGGANVTTSTHKHKVTAHTRAGLHARAQARGPQTTPPGWRHGRKTGWHCGSPPRPGCKPPGLR